MLLRPKIFLSLHRMPSPYFPLQASSSRSPLCQGSAISSRRLVPHCHTASCKASDSLLSARAHVPSWVSQCDFPVCRWFPFLLVLFHLVIVYSTAAYTHNCKYTLSIPLPPHTAGHCVVVEVAEQIRFGLRNLFFEIQGDISSFSHQFVLLAPLSTSGAPLVSDLGPLCVSDPGPLRVSDPGPLWSLTWGPSDPGPLWSLTRGPSGL